MTNSPWSLQDAKNRFSAVVDAALSGQPQLVTRRGKPVAVVLSAETYERLHRLEQAQAPSFVDLLLEVPDREACYVEIKCVTLRRDGEQVSAPRAEFPDAVTARGAKHLGELAQVAETGGRAVMFYLVQRGDCSRVAIASDIDPGYARAFDDARARGVEVFCYDCKVGPKAIDLREALPLDG